MSQKNSTASACEETEETALENWQNNRIIRSTEFIYTHELYIEIQLYIEYKFRGLGTGSNLTWSMEMSVTFGVLRVACTVVCCDWFIPPFVTCDTDKSSEKALSTVYLIIFLNIAEAQIYWEDWKDKFNLSKNFNHDYDARRPQ